MASLTRRNFILGSLGLIGALGVSGCSSEPSPEELAADAPELDAEELIMTVNSNEARAMEDYDGKLFKWTATIRRIESEYVLMSVELFNGAPLNPLYVYLPTETIADYEVDDTITVIGTVKVNGSFTSLKDASVVE